MIKIQVDEAYAFDYLSILQIKRVLSPQALKNFEETKDFIKSQLDIQLFATIITSKEYDELLVLNQTVYNMVDRIKSGEKLDAAEVDRLNSERFKTKQELQLKYFGEPTKLEVKSFDVHKS